MKNFRRRWSDVLTKSPDSRYRKRQARFAKARATANGCPRSRFSQEAKEDYKDARARYQ